MTHKNRKKLRNLQNAKTTLLLPLFFSSSYNTFFLRFISAWVQVQKICVYLAVLMDFPRSCETVSLVMHVQSREIKQSAGRNKVKQIDKINEWKNKHWKWHCSLPVNQNKQFKIKKFRKFCIYLFCIQFMYVECVKLKNTV